MSETKIGDEAECYDCWVRGIRVESPGDGAEGAEELCASGIGRGDLTCEECEEARKAARDAESEEGAIDAALARAAEEVEDEEDEGSSETIWITEAHLGPEATRAQAEAHAATLRHVGWDVRVGVGPAWPLSAEARVRFGRDWEACLDSSLASGEASS